MSLPARYDAPSMPSRSAQLMRALGPDADAVWDALSPDEAARLRSEMADIGDRSETSVTARTFLTDMANTPNSAETATGARLSTLSIQRTSDVLSFVNQESPQVTAVILSLLPEKTAAATLQSLPKETAIQALHRLMHIKDLHPSAIKAVEQAFETHTKSNAKPSHGLDRLAGIMNMVDGSTVPLFMAGLDDIEIGSAERIRALMFTFDDLANLDSASLQTLLSRIDRAVLIIALQDAKTATADAFYQNMTSRSGEVLRSEIESGGPYRRAEIEEARREIAALAKKLARRGDLLSASQPDQDLVE